MTTTVKVSENARQPEIRPTLEFISRSLSRADHAHEVLDIGTFGAMITFDDGKHMFADNLENILPATPRRTWQRTMDRFLDSLQAGFSSPSTMGEVELLTTAHSRLVDHLPESPVAADDPLTYDYARKFAPFYEVLQIKMGGHLSFLTDQHIKDRDLDLLFAAARKNTEQINCNVDFIQDPQDGALIWMLEGGIKFDGVEASVH